MKAIPDFPAGTLERVQSLCTELSNGCRIMTGSVPVLDTEISSVYAVNRPVVMAHRYFYSIDHPDVDLTQYRLKRTCGTVNCVNPQHYRQIRANVVEPSNDSLPVSIPESLWSELDSARGVDLRTEETLSQIRGCLGSFEILGPQKVERVVQSIRRLVSSAGPTPDLKTLECRIVLTGVHQLSELTTRSATGLSRLFTNRISTYSFWKIVTGDLPPDLVEKIREEFPEDWSRIVEFGRSKGKTQPWHLAN